MLPTTSTAQVATSVAILPAWCKCGGPGAVQVTGVAGVTGIEFSASSPGVAIFTESWDSLLQAWSHSFQVSMGRDHGPCHVQQRPTKPFADKVVPSHQVGLQSQRHRLTEDKLLVQICCGNAGPFLLKSFLWVQFQASDAAALSGACA